AGRQHLDAIDRTAGGWLVAAVEDDPVTADRARAAGVPVRPFAEVLADPAVDLVALCVPPGDRPPIIADALAAGKHLLVEKVPARSASELDELLAATHRANRSAGVMFQHRFALPESLRNGAPQRFAHA